MTRPSAQANPDIRILGSFSGSLSNVSDRVQLIDRTGNLADEVRYYDGGYWPEYADGGGAKILNCATRTPTTITHRLGLPATSQVVPYGNTLPMRHHRHADRAEPAHQFSRIGHGVVESGEVWIDNLSVIEDPSGTAVELMQNGTFQNDTPGTTGVRWRALGTHQESRVMVDPANPENKVLRLLASGRMNYLSNHLESTLANNAKVTDGRTYQVSFDAKWITGSPQLHTELYYKDAARTTVIQQPKDSGTPGRPKFCRQDQPWACRR